MAMAADSLVEPLRALTVLRTDLTHRSNLRESFIFFSPKKKEMPESKDFAKSISNETLCEYFFIVFVLISVFAGIAVLTTVVLLWKRPTQMGMALLQMAPSVAIAVVNSLFLYLLCSRSLLK